MSALRSAKNFYHLPHRLTERAEILAACGRTGEAVEEAAQSVAQTGERWYEAEVLRKQAILLGKVAPSDSRRVEELLERALAIAESQGARLWKLRAAVALARLWAGQGGDGKARTLLAPLCAQFENEAAAPDVFEAHATLAALRPVTGAGSVSRRAEFLRSMVRSHSRAGVFETTPIIPA